MTFVFFLGVLLVFIPLGLGFSALGKFFSRYHQAIFTLGGLFFLILGMMLVFGKKFALPFSLHPKLKIDNAASVLMLGILSGIATTCCAPVLAGVMALSVLPGSLIWGMIYALAYVLGMVSPLFVISLALDRSRLMERMMKAVKPIVFRIAGREISVGPAEFLSGAVFIVIGLLTLSWGATREVSTHSEFQVSINIALARFQQSMATIIAAVPGYIWGLAVIGLLALIVFVTYRQLTRDRKIINQNEYDQQK
mgnify:FL=1